MLVLKQYFPNKRACRVSIVDTLYDAVRVLESDEAFLFNVEDREITRMNCSQSVFSLLQEMEEAGDYIDIYHLIDEVLAKQRCEEDD